MPPRLRVPGEDDGYMLGHRPDELRRLGLQARLIDAVTRRFLIAAGVSPGRSERGSACRDLANRANDRER